MPMLTEETRKEMIKVGIEEAEKARVSVPVTAVVMQMRLLKI